MPPTKKHRLEACSVHPGTRAMNQKISMSRLHFERKLDIGSRAELPDSVTLARLSPPPAQINKLCCKALHCQVLFNTAFAYHGRTICIEISNTKDKSAGSIARSLKSTRWLRSHTAHALGRNRKARQAAVYRKLIVLLLNASQSNVPHTAIAVATQRRI